jgi:hypothetical protein
MGPPRDRWARLGSDRPASGAAGARSWCLVEQSEACARGPHVNSKGQFGKMTNHDFCQKSIWKLTCGVLRGEGARAGGSWGLWCMLWVGVCGVCFGSGFGVWGLGFRVQGSGFRVQGFGFRVLGSGFRDPGSGIPGFRVPDLPTDMSSLLSALASSLEEVRGVASGEGRGEERGEGCGAF